MRERKGEWGSGRVGEFQIESKRRSEGEETQKEVE
jgi:hypothetical protein